MNLQIFFNEAGLLKEAFLPDVDEVKRSRVDGDFLRVLLKDGTIHWYRRSTIDNLVFIPIKGRSKIQDGND